MTKLIIEISEGDNDGADVTILGVNLPEPPDDPDGFAEWDKRRSAICNGIHALLASLGPVPGSGWKVNFWV